MFVQTLVTEPPVQRFDVGVLVWLAGLDQSQRDSLAMRPRQHGFAGELRAVVGADDGRCAALRADPVEDAREMVAADLAPEDERARTSGVMFGGQAIGIAATTALGGLLLADFGLRGAALACAAYGAVVLAAVLMCRERPGERLLPWSAGEASAVSLLAHVGAWGPVFLASLKAMKTRGSLLLLGAMLMAGAGWGLGLGAFPLLATQEAGMTQQEYGALSASSLLLGGILALLVFGLVADLIGPLRLLRAAFFVSALAAATMLLVPFGALAMGLCVPAVAATQMTLFGAMGNLGMTLAGVMLGPLDAAGGKPAMVGAMLAFFVAGLALALAMRRYARDPGPAAVAGATLETGVKV